MMISHNTTGPEHVVIVRMSVFFMMLSRNNTTGPEHVVIVRMSEMVGGVFYDA